MDSNENLYSIELPSNSQWRLKKYFGLVEYMRFYKPGDKFMSVSIKSIDECWKRIDCWNPWKQSNHFSNEINYWNKHDLYKAGEILLHNYKKNNDKVDSESLRPVFTLIFETLRFKSIFMKCLNSINFYHKFPSLSEKGDIVYLVFYDFIHNNFEKQENYKKDNHRSHLDAITTIEEALSTVSISLAASLARMKINAGIRSLDKLLPKHLQKPKHSSSPTIVTGWINPIKISFQDFNNLLSRNLGIQLDENNIDIHVNCYSRDHLISYFIHIHCFRRQEIINSFLVKQHLIIIQEKRFCYGPLILCYLLNKLSLGGHVVQSHIYSAKASAFLAILLTHNTKISKLTIFGSGARKLEFEEYFKEIGIENIELRTEQFTEIESKGNILENVSAVLACPENSNSAVLNPIELLLTGEEDLNFLYNLTKESDNFYVSENILNEQYNTLKQAMFKPQIQLIVYETFSKNKNENELIVTNVINEINKLIYEKHIQEIIESDNFTGNPANVTIEVPNCDEFEQLDIPIFCDGADCLDLSKEGVSISVIQRKEITKFDYHFMIQVATERGLFGSNASKNKKNKVLKKGSQSNSADESV